MVAVAAEGEAEGEGEAETNLARTTIIRAVAVGEHPWASHPIATDFERGREGVAAAAAAVVVAGNSRREEDKG